MHFIAEIGRLDVMRALVSAGTPSDIPVRDHVGATPLSSAASRGHAHVVKYLVGTCGAAVDRRHGERNSTVLHRAAQRGLPQVVAALLVVFVSFNHRDRPLRTPLARNASLQVVATMATPDPPHLCLFEGSEEKSGVFASIIEDLRFVESKQITPNPGFEPGTWQSRQMLLH